MATAPNSKTNADDGWEDVETEAQLVMDTDGDEYVGTFQGWSETDSGIPQAHFSNDEGTVFINCGWSLKQQLKNVQKGTLTRLLRTGTQDTGQKSPMVLFKVQTKRR